MKAFGMATLGADMEVRFLPDGTPVGQVSLAFRLSKKDKGGEYMTQWISGSLFGKRAEAIAPFMLKGSKHAFHLRDIRIDEFTGKDGDKRVSLKADIDDVELGSKQQSEPAQHTASRNAMKAQAPADYYDGGDIPF